MVETYYIFVQTNKHGEGAVHIAAGLGKLDILKVSLLHHILHKNTYFSPYCIYKRAD
jgi:hypothetical protein